MNEKMNLGEVLDSTLTMKERAIFSLGALIQLALNNVLCHEARTDVEDHAALVMAYIDDSNYEPMDDSEDDDEDSPETGDENPEGSRPPSLRNRVDTLEFCFEKLHKAVVKSSGDKSPDEKNGVAVRIIDDIVVADVIRRSYRPDCNCPLCKTVRDTVLSGIATVSEEELARFTYDVDMRETISGLEWDDADETDKHIWNEMGRALCEEYLIVKRPSVSPQPSETPSEPENANLSPVS